MQIPSYSITEKAIPTVSTHRESQPKPPFWRTDIQSSVMPKEILSHPSVPPRSGAGPYREYRWWATPLRSPEGILFEYISYVSVPVNDCLMRLFPSISSRFAGKPPTWLEKTHRGRPPAGNEWTDWKLIRTWKVKMPLRCCSSVEPNPWRVRFGRMDGRKDF